MAAACVRRVQCRLGSRVMASSLSLCTSAPAAEAQRPKKPSPYRLLTPDQRDELLPPLRAQGWRVQPLASASQPVTTPDASTDTEQEELVGTFAFRHENGRVPAQRAWRSTLAFVQRVGEIVEAEDHHPTITITPDGCGRGFTVKIQTHTHAPLAIPRGVPDRSESITATSTAMPFTNPEPRMRPAPNLTRKDASLASLVSAAYERASSAEVS